MRQILLSLIAPFFVSTSIAAPVTYACTYLANPLSEFAKIDQIIVDREAQTFELRIANTMGTTNEVNYRFKDLGSPDDTIVWHVSGPRDRVAGTRFAIPFILERDGNRIALSFADGLPLLYHEWACTS